jgi:hypothetical protein
VPKVTLHVSPQRLNQLLEVLNTVLPAATGPTDPAPWVKAAEYTSPVDTLVWQGFALPQSQWQERYAVVYRGTLYILEREGSPVILRQVALWQQHRIIPVHPDQAGGQHHVLAVMPAHLSKERNILEEPSALVIRLQSEYMLHEWTRRLRHSAAQMRSVAAWYQTNRVCQGFTIEAYSSIVNGSSG